MEIAHLANIRMPAFIVGSIAPVVNLYTTSTTYYSSNMHFIGLIVHTSLALTLLLEYAQALPVNRPAPPTSDVPPSTPPTLGVLAGIPCFLYQLERILTDLTFVPAALQIHHFSQAQRQPKSHIDVLPGVFIDPDSTDSNGHRPYLLHS